ncbi:hypothetical protein I4U23_001473 [Adineta vaga]|nr:hypothetical protein I4U23_001473 [Adineta vaga]
MNDIDSSLLSATETNDINSLKTLLLSTTNPLAHLNHLYNISENHTCTLLMIACLNDYEDMVRMLLNSFQFDLEVLNLVRISVNRHSPKVYENVTVLWIAAANNSFNIMKLLIEHGAQINHRIKTNSTPFRCVCYHGNVTYARYLIKHGADITIKKEHNDTNLILSVFREHVELVRYLVDELGCDVNECDDEKRSPLFLAVERGSLELVQFLIDRGARNFPTKHDRITPLILAAEKRRTDLVDIIVSHCSVFEQIEAEELLGSAFACREYGACNLEEAYQHISKAFQLRSIHQLPKSLKQSTHEIFNYRQECQTNEQLYKLRTNSDDLHIEALLIRERLLGPTHFKYHHSLLQRAVTLAYTSQYQQGIALWNYTLKLQQQHKISIHSKQLRYLVKTFAIIINKWSAIRIEDLCELIDVITDRLDHDSKEFDINLFTLLFFITMTCQVLTKTSTNHNDLKIFYQLIHSINRKRYTTQIDGSSLLHLALNEQTSSSDIAIDRLCKYPCLYTVRTLLLCGADIDANNTKRNTPLHIFISNSYELNESIFQLLCAYDAHLDWVNIFNETPLDLISDSRIKELLKVKTQLKLKCLCARLIQKEQIPFRENIAHSLVTFVERH